MITNSTGAPVQAGPSAKHQAVQIGSFGVLVPQGYALSIDDVEWDEDHGITELTLSFTQSFVSQAKEAQPHG